MIRIEVPGIPVGQGNHRRNQYGATYETSKNHKPWRDSIIAAVRAVLPESDDWIFPGPVDVTLLFTFPRPKSHYGTGRNAGTLKTTAPEFKATKPDIDKIERAVLDAITQAGGVWRDDAQVAQVFKAKEYGPRPGLVITIGSLR